MYEAKKYKEAESVFKTVPEKAREYAAARYYLGRIAFDQRAYDDAADYFEQATNPREADYFNKLGAAYAAIAKNANVFTQASMALKLKKAWEKVVELEPENVEARVSLFLLVG